MKQKLLMQKSQCKRLTMFCFHFKNCSNKLLCIYNALCLSQLEIYKLHKNHKLKQAGKQDQKTSKKSRLGTLAWVQTMTWNHYRLKKGKCKPVTDRKQTGKNRAQDPDHWSGLRHLNQQPKQARTLQDVNSK